MPYHWGRYRGLAQDLRRPPLPELLRNVFFDTCVYHQAGIDLLTKVVPVENILFASEMVGAVRGIDPETGRHFDDTKRFIDAAPNLSEADRRKIYEGNARRVYPRLGGKARELSGSALSPSPSCRLQDAGFRGILRLRPEWRPKWRSRSECRWRRARLTCWPRPQFSSGAASRTRHPRPASFQATPR